MMVDLTRIVKDFLMRLGFCRVSCSAFFNILQDFINSSFVMKQFEKLFSENTPAEFLNEVNELFEKCLSKIEQKRILSQKLCVAVMKKPLREYVENLIRGLGAEVIDNDQMHHTYKRFVALILESPIMTFRLSKKLFIIKEPINVIFIRPDFCQHFNDLKRQIFAALLHEIGHIVNKPSSTFENSNEFYADDYARYCGFSSDLESNLEACRAIYPEIFETDVVHKRVLRIQQSAELLLNSNFSAESNK